jgi:hypothetical protein
LPLSPLIVPESLLTARASLMFFTPGFFALPTTRKGARREGRRKRKAL